MSARAGPVRNNRRQARQAPYSVPSRHRPGQGAAPVARPSLFTRIKQFFWGAPAPARLPRESEPPVLLGQEDSRYRTDADSQINVAQLESSRFENSRFESSRFEGSRFEGSRIEVDEYADIDSDTSTGSRIVHTARSFSTESPVVVADGPNEALRQFFETKGDEELSNMEVVGVLSLIGQAVSRNESLVDFSQLSTDHESELEGEPSITDSSGFRAFDVPPSPQAYRKGTPPTSVRKAVDRSPWNSTPRRSSIRARHSLATAPPRRSSVGPQQARPMRPSGLRNSLLPSDINGGSRASHPKPTKVTPAASAILQALDTTPDDRASLSRTRTYDGESTGDFSTHTLDTPTSQRAPLSQRGPTLSSKLSRFTEAPAATTSSRSAPEPIANNKSRISDASASSSNASAPPVAQYAPPKPAAGDSAISQPTKPAAFEPVHVPINEQPGAGVNIPSYSFDIPVSTAPREMTPAEEAIVAETRSEFTF